MANEDVRLLAKGAGVALWEIADYIGVSEATVTRILRKSLDSAKKKKIIEAIEEIRERRQQHDR